MPQLKINKPFFFVFFRSTNEIVRASSQASIKHQHMSYVRTGVNGFCTSVSYHRSIIAYKFCFVELIKLNGVMYICILASDYHCRNSILTLELRLSRVTLGYDS